MLGMMLANAPVVWLGSRVTQLIPLRVVNIVSALIFAGLGLLVLVLPAWIAILIERRFAQLAGA